MLTEAQIEALRAPFPPQAEERPRVRDLPLRERPVTRLREVGPGAVSSAELLACLLQTPDALHQAQVLLSRFEGLDARSDHHDLLHGILEEHLRTQPADHWLARLQGEHVPCARVNRIDQALSLPHTEHREMVVDVEHPTAGRFRMLGNPVKVDGVEDRFAPPPLLGQDTDELLGTLLGYDEEEIARLRESGVVR